MGTWIKGRGSVVRAAARVAPLSLRVRAGPCTSGHPRSRDRAMARRIRKLHAADRRRSERFRGNGFAHRRLFVHQYRYGGDRHRREMAGDRQDEAWALSSMGSLLFPLVAGEAFPWTGPYQMVPGFP